MEHCLTFIFLMFFSALSAIMFGINIAKDLQMLQQNSYRNERYIQWIKNSGDTTSIRRLFNVVLFVLAISSLSDSIFVLSAAAISMIVECVILIMHKSKKPLVFTKRIWRLFLSINILVWVCAALFAAIYNTNQATALTSVYDIQLLDPTKIR